MTQSLNVVTVALPRKSLACDACFRGETIFELFLSFREGEVVSLFSNRRCVQKFSRLVFADDVHGSIGYGRRVSVGGRRRGSLFARKSDTD